MLQNLEKFKHHSPNASGRNANSRKRVTNLVAKGEQWRLRSRADASDALLLLLRVRGQPLGQVWHADAVRHPVGD